MQPFLFISCPIAGILYVNGRLWSQITQEGTCVPASRTGAVFIEFKPLAPGFLALARSLCLSGGNVVDKSVSDERGMKVVRWPGGVSEIALEPEPREGYRDEPPGGVLLDGRTRQVVTPLNDEVGHAVLETYRETAGEWTAVEREVMWDAGCPKWPKNPESTAIAAAQAAILGQTGEAAGYAAYGHAQVERALAGLHGVYDGCARAAYRVSRDAVALVRVVSKNLAKVDCAKYSCCRLGGGQGEWKLDGFKIETEG